MKKTLLICTVYPLPENTGTNIRTMNFVRFFYQFGPVDIVYTFPSPDGKANDSVFRNRYLLERRAYPRDFFSRLSLFLKGEPYPIRPCAEHGRDALISAINNKHYDYIMVRYIVNAHCLFGLPVRDKEKIILDFDDLLSGSLYSTLFDDAKSLFKRMMRNVNRHLLLRYEKKCLNLNISLFCSQEDKKRTAGSRNNCFVVPNIYSNAEFENYNFGNGIDNKNVLLFVGVLSYVPNVEGLKWFIESIFPKLRTEHPDTKLVVVGRFPTDEIKALCKSSEGVELHHDVPDVREFYKRCTAVVVPLLSGGGTRIKILEAALTGRPVLSTPVGAEGLDFVDGKDLLLFRSAEEFSSCYHRISNHEEYGRLVKNGRETVIRKYSVDEFNDAMKRILQKMEA